MSGTFYILHLIHNLRALVDGCHLCQTLKNVKLTERQFQKRTYFNYKPMSSLSMNLKAMPRSLKEYK